MIATSRIVVVDQGKHQFVGMIFGIPERDVASAHFLSRRPKLWFRTTIHFNQGVWFGEKDTEG